MKELISAICLTLSLVACGGGGDAALAISGQGAPEALMAKRVSAPTSPVAEPVSVVNTTTAGQQVLRAIGALSDGGHTVAWVSENTTLFIQRYDSAGDKVGGEIAVPLSGAAINDGGLAVLSDGSIVVAYSDTRAVPFSSSYKRAVYIQRFDATGAQVLPENEVVARVEVIHSRSPYFGQINVVALPEGGFVVGWADIQPSSVGIFGNTIFTRRYDSQGQPSGDAVMVGRFSAYAGGVLYRLAADSQGEYTVSLFQRSTNLPLSTLTSVFHFDADGKMNPIVPETAATVLLLPLADDRFVLFTSDASGSFLQWLDSAGNGVGAPMPLSSMPVEARELTDESFVVFWNTGGNATAQRYGARGEPLGDLLTIATGGAVPAVTALVEGGFALAWSAPATAGDLDVYTQRFTEVLGNERAAVRAQRKTCLASAKGMTGRDRKAFMDACLQ